MKTVSNFLVFGGQSKCMPEHRCVPFGANVAPYPNTSVDQGVVDEEVTNKPTCGNNKEVCNGKDDNCNGKIDEGCNYPVCIPTAEICDGMDKTIIVMDR